MTASTGTRPLTTSTGEADFKVADLSLAGFGRKEIQLAEHEMPGLMALRAEYGDAQRTSAPSAVSVSMSTAVCTVMCSEPVIRAPLSGCSAANSARVDMRPGISCSASWISLRPKAASERSATLKSVPWAIVVMWSP